MMGRFCTLFSNVTTSTALFEVSLSTHALILVCELFSGGQVTNTFHLTTFGFTLSHWIVSFAEILGVTSLRMEKFPDQGSSCAGICL